MALLLGVAAVFSTLLGGLFALKRQDKLHLILGFSAGAVIGVAFFDLLPEALELGTKRYGASPVATTIAVGFLLYMLLNRVVLLHPHVLEDDITSEGKPTWLGAGSLCIHSFLDGMGIGLAFQASTAVGVVVAMAVLAHDFSDGINTVGMVLKNTGERRQAFRWLLVDAVAPPLGVISTFFFSLHEAELGLVLALFCGFFLFIGASDLLPEAQHRHPKLVTSLLTMLGAFIIYVAIHVSRI
ncbi:MAG TPA: ZIP family metal transporter [Thermoanaerobaculaceae bacterium]|nr:ZIP family metal transporter [Thermoanaerobaculaceae bacterium]